MKLRTHTRLGCLLALAALPLMSLGCAEKVCTGFDAAAPDSGPLQRVANFGAYQVTGVAVSSSGRVFVNFPRWDGPHRYSVAEVQADGSLRPYPDESWNEPQVIAGKVYGGRVIAQEALTVEGADGREPAEVARTTGDAGGPWFFSCVQSVHIDDKDRLWVLDNACPRFAGVRRGAEGGGGPKLVQIDLRTNQAVSIVTLDPDAAPYDSYLNDVRVDTRTDTAYITDSGAGGSGAIVVVDIATNRARRLLADDPSTQADPSRTIVVQGAELRDQVSGQALRIHSDGIALDTKNNILYWQSLTGDRLYAADARLLRSRTAPEWQIANSVHEIGRTCVTDGLLTDGVGDVYFTALEHDAVLRLDGDRARKALAQGRPVDLTRALEEVVRDPRLGWPDSLAMGAQGPIGTEGTPVVGGGKWLYITTSQIHRSARFAGSSPTTGARTDTDSAAAGQTGDSASAGAPAAAHALYRVRVR